MSDPAPNEDPNVKAALDLFAALGQLRGPPACLCVAAGVLAVVAAPPNATAWIASAHRAALAHGTRGFAELFAQAVTKPSPEPSSE